jgi:hypothetical protein
VIVCSAGNVARLDYLIRLLRLSQHYSFLETKMTKLNPLDVPSEATMVAIYQELHKSFLAIDDFRSKLLALLPLVTGAAAIALLNNLTSATEKYLEPIGYFMAVFTFGLFAYEIFGIRKCHALIKSGKRIEIYWLHVEDGEFCRRPHSLLDFVDEPFAAGIIYPAVTGSWLYLALKFSYPELSVPIPMIVFLIGFVGMLFYDRWLGHDGAKFDKKIQHEINGKTPDSY